MGAKRLRRWTLILVGGVVIGVGLVALQEATTDPTPVLVATETISDIAPGTAVVLRSVVVSSVTDGDTLRLASGDRVRLLQVDAPEREECYARGATWALARLAPPGAKPHFSFEPQFGERDDYGRLLLYVEIDEQVVNLELVRQGAAVPYFFRGQRGAIADELLAAAKDARRNRRGLWGACPRAKLDPNRGSLTGPAS